MTILVQLLSGNLQVLIDFFLRVISIHISCVLKMHSKQSFELSFALCEAQAQHFPNPRSKPNSFYNHQCFGIFDLFLSGRYVQQVSRISDITIRVTGKVSQNLKQKYCQSLLKPIATNITPESGGYFYTLLFYSLNL